MSYNKSRRLHKTDLHLQYQRETGNSVPKSIKHKDVEEYVNWLEGKAENPTTKVNFITGDEDGMTSGVKG
jgi:hypothetical protein